MAERDQHSPAHSFGGVCFYCGRTSWDRVRLSWRVYADIRPTVADVCGRCADVVARSYYDVRPVAADGGQA